MRHKKKPVTHKATISGRVIKSPRRIKTSTGKVMASLTLEAESDTHIITTSYSATDDPSTTSQRKSRRNRKRP